MNLGEIVAEVRTNLKDQRSDVLVSIQDYVNEAYQWVAAESCLPSLKSVTTLNTALSLAYTSFAATFDGRLLYCGTTSGELNVLDGGLTELIERHPDLTEEGDVEDVAVEGATLWYACIPATVTSLICLVYNKPAELTLDTDTPSALPVYLHREILVNKACAIGYSIIEDGLEGERPNTSFYEAKALIGKAKLDAWIEKRRGHLRRSVWSY